MPILLIARLLATALLIAFATLAARADCIADAAARHHVSGDVLRAIGWQESRLQPLALGRNANGSIDVGAFQINSTHLGELARYGVDRAALNDGCVSAEVAAWHYRRQVDREGDTWLAVGAYHSRTPARAAGYANRIAAILMRWRVMPAGPLPFPAEHTPSPDATRQSPSLASSAKAPHGPVSDRPSSEQGHAVYDALDFEPPAR